MQGQLIQNFRTIANRNLLPFGATFQDLATINFTGTENSSVVYSSVNPFYGTKCIYSLNALANNNSSADLVFDFGDSLKTVIDKTVPITGGHQLILSIPIRQNQNNTQYRAIQVLVRVSVNGTIIPSREMVITLPDEADENPDTTNLLRNKWYVFAANIGAVQLGDEVNFQFVHKWSNEIQGFSEIWIGEPKLEIDDRNLSFVPTTYTPPSNVIKKTQNINFGSVAANTITSQTFSFPYALLSNFLEVIPNNSVRSPGVTFEAWISSPGTATLQVTNGTSSTIVFPDIDYSFILTK